MRSIAALLCTLCLGALACTPTVADDDDVSSDDDDAAPDEVQFVAVDTALTDCFRLNNEQPIDCPDEGEPFYGQDGHFTTPAPSYSTSADGAVVTDLHTGLMWEQGHHEEKLEYADAEAACEGLELGGRSDWRLPSLKELYSLADFRGEVGGAFYLDADTFELAVPDDGTLTGTHAYDMMGQTISSTPRFDDSSRGHYFFNFLDGHIKSSPDEGDAFASFYRCVSGDPEAFENDLVDNGDGTVTDEATGLIWQQDNAEQTPGDHQFDWESALAVCADLSLGGADDWRLPNIKELQTIVDYGRLEPSLDPVFGFEQAAGTGAYTWSSTSMINYPDWATYICFAECLSATGQDIHGPGAQRADPKVDQGLDWTGGIGDQQDVVQMDNYVRCVR
jgi:hypothetical protein